VLDDLFDAPRVEQLEVHGAAARGIDPLAAVLVREPKQLLRLAQLRLGEVTGE